MINAITGKNQGSSYYYTPELAETSVKKKRAGRGLIKLFPALLLALLTLFSGSAALVSQTTTNTANADVARFVMCDLIGTEETKAVYEFTSTDKWRFDLFSKSTINFGTEKVDAGYNMFLSLFGGNYNKTNSEILGAPLGVESVLDSEGNLAEYTYNGGDKVNPFDRFGFSGLNFTSYMGEWKYIAIEDACSATPTTVDPEANKYYDERQEPRSTWDSIDNSKDIRTKQYAMGFGQFYIMSLANIVNNLLFSVTKFFVAVTVTFIKFSFVDLSQVLGITDMIYGAENGDSKGLYKQLHEQVFMPIAGIIFILAGAWLVIEFLKTARGSGSIKGALKTLMRSIAIFLIAVVLYAGPTSILQLPNNIAHFGQALIISALTPELQSEDSLCSTNVAGSASGRDLLSGATSGELSETEKFSENISSAVSCIYWKTFLFTPWVQGQFGTEYSNLFAEETDIPAWAPEGSKTIGNKDNTGIVGDAAVPMGGREVINNWGLFALSVNTNAHAPYGKEGEISTYSSGVSNDWWRIVDATSNFFQEETKSKIGGKTSLGDKQPGSEAGEGWDGYGNAADTRGEGDKPLPKVWVKPAEGLNISGYGEARSLPDGSSDIHTGIDLASQCERPVVSPADGVVAWVGHESFGGLSVLIQHGGAVTSFFVHLAEGSVVVKPGDDVKAGDEVAKVGLTGKTFGCHLHFEMRDNSPRGAWYDFKSTMDPDSFLRKQGVNMDDPGVGGEGSGGSGGNSSGTSSSRNNAGKEVTVAKITETQPTDYWDSWTGSSPMNRMGTVMTSILVAIFGLIPTIVPAFMSALYSIATSLMMLFLPVIMLLGIGTESMFAAFLGYLASLAKIIMKRWVAALILAFSIIFTSMAMTFFTEMGWWQGMLSLVLLAILLITARKKFNMSIDRFSMGGKALSGGIDKMAQRLGKTVKGAGSVATAGIAGGVTAKRFGGSFMQGIGRGAANEVRNVSYRSNFGRQALRTYDSISAQNKGAHASEMNEALKYCNACGQPLENWGVQIMSRDDYGFFYCDSCVDDKAQGVPDDIQEVTIDFTVGASQDAKTSNEVKTVKTAFAANQQGQLSKTQHVVNQSKNTAIPDKAIEAAISDAVIEGLSADMAEVLRARGNLEKFQVELPEEISSILDKTLVDKAWESSRNYSYLESAYALAWANLIEEESGRVLDKQAIALKVTQGVEAKRTQDEDAYRRQKAAGANP